MPAMLTVFKAEEWDNYGLMMVDSSLIYSIVDVLLGGRRGIAPMRIEGRPYTTIERNLVERMVHVVLNDMSAAFDPLAPVTFRFERLESNPRFATIARAANATIVSKLRVDMGDRGGYIELMLPHATLEPVRELLAADVHRREVRARFHLGTPPGDRALANRGVDRSGPRGGGTAARQGPCNWAPGSRLELNCLPSSKIKLRCGDIAMFDGQMGRKGPEHRRAHRQQARSTTRNER